MGVLSIMVMLARELLRRPMVMSAQGTPPCSKDWRHRIKDRHAGSWHEHSGQIRFGKPWVSAHPPLVYPRQRNNLGQSLRCHWFRSFSPDNLRWDSGCWMEAARPAPEGRSSLFERHPQDRHQAALLHSVPREQEAAPVCEWRFLNAPPYTRGLYSPSSCSQRRLSSS